MSVESLCTQPLTIISYSEPHTLDAYGNQIPTETTTNVKGYLEEQSRRENEGWIPTGVFNLILPPTVTIQADDRVESGGEEYRVTGLPTKMWNPRRQIYSHIQATLTRTSGAQQ